SLPPRFKVRTAHLPLLAGCPIDRAVCDGCDHRGSCCRRCFLVAIPMGICFCRCIGRCLFFPLSPNPATVISTEAPHGFIVRRAVEKSAFCLCFNCRDLLSQTKPKNRYLNEKCCHRRMVSSGICFCLL